MRKRAKYPPMIVSPKNHGKVMEQMRAQNRFAAIVLEDIDVTKITLWRRKNGLVTARVETADTKTIISGLRLR